MKIVDHREKKSRIGKVPITELKHGECFIDPVVKKRLWIIDKKTFHHCKDWVGARCLSDETGTSGRYETNASTGFPDYESVIPVIVSLHIDGEGVAP